MICKSGLVLLKRRIMVEKANYYPSTTKDTYRKRTLQKVLEHTLGEVKPKQVYGVKESLMDWQAYQVPCSLAFAAEPSTLIFFDKQDFVRAFELIDLTSMINKQDSSNFINVVPDSELALRSLHSQKMQDLKCPRPHVFTDRLTPRRIRKLV